MAEKTLPKITPENVRASFSGPAVHSNRVFATMTGGGLRLAFMEQLGEAGEMHFRAAVLLPYPDALELRDLITRQLAEIEKDLKTYAEGLKEAEAGREHG
jgi:hypothetical protein